MLILFSALQILSEKTNVASHFIRLIDNYTWGVGGFNPFKLLFFSETFNILIKIWYRPLCCIIQSNLLTLEKTMQ